MPYPKGKPKSEDSKRKTSISCKLAWTDDKKKIRSTLYSGARNPFFGKRHSGESLQAMSTAHSGVILSEECKKKISQSLFGNQRAKGNRFSLTEEQKRRIGDRSRGDKSSFWRGGVTKKHFLIRSSTAYARWRRLVFERDNYICQQCGYHGYGGRNLNAHHIKAFCLFEDARLDVNNGQSLCIPCHRLTSNFAKNLHYQIN